MSRLRRTVAELDFLTSSHQLEGKAKLTAAVWPLILPRGTAQVRPREVCRVAGWRLMALKGIISNTLWEVELTVEQDEVCESHLYDHYNSSTLLCMGDLKERKTSSEVRLGICLAELGEGHVLGPGDPSSRDSSTP